MDNSVNWFTRNTSIIVITLSIYPWLLLFILHLNGTYKGTVFVPAFEVAIFAFMLSVFNLIISIIFITFTYIFSPSVAQNAVGRFFAINSVSVVWIGLLLYFI
ncbi:MULTISPECIES: hypothetical protein [Klebsiella]|jgi:hypothetical protein|uniref:hypothetical protein n=1 Tax=Klebsiella TaxID=570 RepID=UPI0006692686|nr:MULTISPECIES: hypothetical protein [Klebsiella]EKU6609206.1 hypothetical protein [Klebsiella aerogenes]EKV8808034.1 hypothetical protein [Klebsiella aerogenes]EKW5856323.1 hypothetical protein [Klebsiella aerogenes]EKW8936843.1 hypothetical protein [Klebsiella aerogenes]ELJ2006055.1 hypothetical protein [Klebsiella aerogenes]